jgi:hypothetical protein
VRNVRGLKTRLCSRCGALTPHRTLYAKSESGGRTKWFQLFWACTACGSLNHVTISTYRLESAASTLPSALALGVVNSMQQGPLDFDELVASLRKNGVVGVRHIFNSDVTMALEYLKRRRVVAEEPGDRTERMLDALRARAGESRHLGPCPVDQSTRLVSLYAQKRRRLVPIGVFCLSCGYQHVDSDFVRGLKAVMATGNSGRP